MVAIVRPWALVVALTVSLAAAEARANPDVWVEATIIVAFDDQRVSGLEFSWIFDDFYSARTVQTYDLDRDGALNPLEVKNLRAETFDPLSHGRLFRSRLVGRGKHARATTWIGFLRESKKRSSSTSFPWRLPRRSIQRKRP